MHNPRFGRFQMGKLLRALLLSVVATVGAVFILDAVESRRSRKGRRLTGGTPEVDADSLDPEETKSMLAELEAQL